jgi:hypothetical protein
MLMEAQGPSPSGRYRADVRSVIGLSADAYGYTLTASSAGAMLAQQRYHPIAHVGYVTVP